MIQTQQGQAAVSRTVETKVALDLFQRQEGAALGPITVRRMGDRVPAKPVMVSLNGEQRALLLYDADDAPEARGQVFEIKDPSAPEGVRAIEVWVGVDPVSNGPLRELLPDGQLGRTVMISYDVYVRRNGTMFRLPVYERGDQQTVSRWTQTGNGPQRDLYLSKGFRWATAKDFVDVLEKAVKNKAADTKRKEAQDPLKAQAAMTETLKEALLAYRGATIKESLAAAEKMDAKVTGKGGRKAAVGGVGLTGDSPPEAPGGIGSVDGDGGAT